MTQHKPLLIDVEKALKSKTGRKKPSRILIAFLKRIAHQDEMNTFLMTNTDVKGVEFIDRALNMLNVKLEVYGEENIPNNGRFMFASNHPLGGLDGMTMLHFLGKKYNNQVRALTNDLLMNMGPLTELFTPINSYGSQGRGDTKNLNAQLSSDIQFLIYPAGVCSRFQKGKVCDLQWKKTFISKSIEFERDIIPVYFEAKNSFLFYSIAYLRKLFKIKTNIEMLLLVDEMYKKRNATFKAYIGKPIPWQSIDKSKSLKHWAQDIKDTVYDLKNSYNK